jgi:hypothetical protein
MRSAFSFRLCNLKVNINKEITISVTSWKWCFGNFIYLFFPDYFHLKLDYHNDYDNDDDDDDDVYDDYWDFDEWWRFLKTLFVLED